MDATKSQTSDALKVRNFYSLDSKRLSTPEADLYQARESGTKAAVQVWVGREALSVERQKSLCRHVEEIKGTGVAEILDYGVDSDNIGYVAMRAKASKKLDYDTPLPALARQRFLAAVLLVEHLNHQGVICGNLDADSFSLDASGRLHFIGVYGFGDDEAPARRGFGAKRQEVGGEFGDVCALALMGLALFGADVADYRGEVATLPERLKSLVKDAPVWVTSVLKSILEKGEDSGVSTTSDLLAAIVMAERRSKEPVTKESTEKAVAEWLEKDGMAIARMLHFDLVGQRAKTRAYRVIGVVSALCVVALIGILFLAPRATHNTNGSGGERGGATSSGAAAPQSPRQQVASLAASDDPAAHTKIEEVLARDPSAEARSAVLKAVADRAERLGFPRLAAVIREKAASLSSGSYDALKGAWGIFDPFRDEQSRHQQLLEYAKVDALSACEFAVAIALDIGKPEAFRPVLQSCARQVRGIPATEPIDDLSTAALIFELDGDRMRYIKDLRARRGDLSPRDIWWLLETAVNKRNEGLQLLAEEALARDLVPWPRRLYLEAVQVSAMTPDVPADILLDSARKGASQEAVTRFTKWLDPAAVTALIASLLDNPQEGAHGAAFDALDNKPIRDPFLQAVLELIRLKAGDERARYAPFVGAIALRSRMNDEQLTRGMESIRGAPLERDLYLLSLEKGEAGIIGTSLRVYGTTANPVSLMGLLAHQDPSVRSMVIPYLKTITVSSYREKLRNHYVLERDPSVRAVFEREIPDIRG